MHERSITAIIHETLLPSLPYLSPEAREKAFWEVVNLGRELKPNSPRIYIPNDILTLAARRGIIAKKPYFTNGNKKTVDGSGQEIEERLNPSRVTREKEEVENYLYSLPEEEKKIISMILQKNKIIEPDMPHIAGVEKLNFSLMSDLDPRCKVSVIIPARFEASRIKDVLDGYKEQKDVSNKDYELNVIVNHNINEQPDATINVVMEFMENNPDVTVNVLDVQFDSDHANVGYARKLITDIIMARSNLRKPYKPLFIVSEDADVREVDPKIVQKTIKAFEQNPQIDAIRGRHNRSSALIAQNGLCVFFYKGIQMVETIARDQRLRDPYRKGYTFTWNRVVGGGWASAFTSEAYLLIGGYTQGVMGEDMALGDLISLTRGHFDESGNVVPFTRTIQSINIREESNFLRFGRELITGLPPYSIEQFTDQTVKQEKEIEILSKLEAFASIDPSKSHVIEKFNSILRGQLIFLRYCVGDDNELLQRYVPRFLMMLGFKRGDCKVKIENNEICVEVSNWDNVNYAIERNKKKWTKKILTRYFK